MQEKPSQSIISAKGLSKRYGRFQAVKPMDFTIERGTITGLIGPNGAGKTSILKSILGLTTCDGNLEVFGLNPCRKRYKLMQKVCFIADVAVLPRWLTVEKALAFVEGVHLNFHRNKAEQFLKKTSIQKNTKIGHLSKGMIVQLHLALVLAIDAELLVLDEPTLGLDILFRKEFYNTLLQSFFNEDRAILITTHQIEEINDLLSDVMFIQEGNLVLKSPVKVLSDRFTQVNVPDDKVEEARALNPLEEQDGFNSKIFLFDGLSSEKLAQLGDAKSADLADIFVATLKGVN